MALLRCVDCGRDVSDAAPACPGCGRPNAVDVPIYFEPAPQGGPARQQSAAAAVALSGVRILGCLTIFGGVLVAAFGLFLGGGLLAVCIGGGLALMGVFAAAVTKIA